MDKIGISIGVLPEIKDTVLSATETMGSLVCCTRVTPDNSGLHFSIKRLSVLWYHYYPNDLPLASDVFVVRP
jgi:hypothetical protein